MWDELAEIYMTEESEDETTGVIRQHHIPWQSEGTQNTLILIILHYPCLYVCMYLYTKHYICQI